MRPSTIKFLAAVFGLSVVFIIVEVILNDKMKMNSGCWLLGIFAVSVVGVHLFLLKLAKGSPQFFVTGFMSATALKFFFYVIILVAFLLYSHEDRKVLALHFLLYYMAFTALEVSILYSELGKK